MTASILLLSYEYPPLGGGGAKVVNGLAERYAKLGWHVDVVTMWFWGLPLKDTRNGVTIYRVPCLRLRQNVCSALEMLPYVFFAIAWLWLLTIRRRHTVRHTHFVFPDAVVSTIVKRLTGAPFVVTAHGSDVPGYNPDRFRLLHRLLHPLWQRIVMSADAIITPSRGLEKLIRERAPYAKTLVIPNGIDTNRFDWTREKKPIVLCVTRLFERKGVQYLVDLAPSLPTTWRVVVVGTGPYIGEIRRRVEAAEGRVDLVGFLENDSEELRSLYESAATFAFPSASENFPICLLEAMTAGCAIVTTSGTGCAEVVGDAALLVKPCDQDGLREALARLTQDAELRNSLGKKARQRVVEHFSWKAVVADHIRVYLSGAAP